MVTEDGWIEGVGNLGLEPTQRLPSQALIPGFVSAHSHAFQRGLRGRAQAFAKGRGTFWSWRRKMYELASQIDPDRMYTLCHQAFSEMLAAGITSVGEFHYLHQSAPGGDCDLDDPLLRAARDTGIRLVLLYVFYRSGGFGSPLEKGQQLFATPSLPGFWDRMDRVSGLLGPNQHLGVAAHSLRAVPIEDLCALEVEARRRGYVFHMHLEEQRKEVEECLAFHGKEPMALVLEHCQPGPHFTAVHCTHSLRDQLEDFLETGANICLCPLTEANLGDGLPHREKLLAKLDQVCLGSDQNGRVSMNEEVRLLEYAHRLDSQERGIWLDSQGQLGESLLRVATRNGARSLGIKTGSIEAGFEPISRPSIWLLQVWRVANPALWQRLSCWEMIARSSPRPGWEASWSSAAPV